MRGEWDLVGGDGTWVGNEACPGDIPLVDNERVLVLEPQSLLHSWRAGRRHPHITGALTVLEELHPDEAAAWWARMHPAGSVRHPQAPPIELDDTGSHRRPPRHFGVAAHFAEVDSGPMSASFGALDPELDAPGPGLAPSFEDVTINPGAPSAPETPVASPFTSDGAEDPDEPDDFAVPAMWAAPSGPSAPPGHGFDDPFDSPLDEPAWRAPRPLPEPEAEPLPAPVDDGLPPGARLLPPMPPGVSDSSTWAPDWKWPMRPPER